MRTSRRDSRILSSVRRPRPRKRLTVPVRRWLSDSNMTWHVCETFDYSGHRRHDADTRPARPDISPHSRTTRPVPHFPAMPMTVPAIAALVLYLGAATLLAAPLTGCPRAPRRLGLSAAVIAVALHAFVLLGAHGGRLDLHFFAALSLVAGVVAALTLLVNLWRPVAGLGVIVFPLAALLLALDVFIAPPTRPLPIDWQITLHVAIALLSYSLLSIAAEIGRASCRGRVEMSGGAR